MNLTVSKSELQTRLIAISKIIPSKPSLPIMASFLFETKDNRLFLASSSEEGQIKTSIECQADAEIKFCIPAASLLDALKSLPEQPIQICLDENNLEIKIKYSGGKFQMMGQSADDFPTMKPVDSVGSITLSNKDFNTYISRVQHLAADSDLRPILNAVFIESGDGKINFVGTDGYAMGVVTKMVEGCDEISLIISKKIAGILKSIVPNTEDEIKIEVGKTNAHLSFSDFEMIFRQVEGKYPNYRSVIPNNKKILKINTESLKGACNRVSVFSGISKLVTFDVDSEQLTITSKDVDFSTGGEEAVSCEFNSDKMQVYLKTDILSSILQYIHSGCTHIHLEDATKAVLVFPEENKSGEELLYLMMPYAI